MRIRYSAKKLILLGVIFLAVLLLAILFAACQGPAGTAGPAGPAGAPGPAGTGAAITGTISGKVTNSITGGPVAGVKIATDPVIPNVNITTDASGAFSTQLPVGVYTLNLTRANFTAGKETASVVAGQTVTKNVVMKPVSNVGINAGAAQQAAPGATVTLKATAEPLDGSTVTGYEWTQVSGVPAVIASAKADTTTITLGQAPAYKVELVKRLEILDRVMVMGINPHSLTDANTVTFKVTVTTSSGKYSGTTTVAANLPYEFTLGIQNVPIGVPVLLNGKQQSSYNWSIAGPTGSTVKLDDPASRNPVFTPDATGKYTLTEANSKATIDVYAGRWAGAISGIDQKGRPLSAGCTACHNGTTASDNFKDWKETGHAEIFAQNLNTATYYGEQCLACHTVGFNKAAANGGFDEIPDYGKFLKEGITNKPNPNNWANVVKNFPRAAALGNIQCENCHGPNNASGLHDN
ncbi:MAG: hypothetical protein Q8O16_05560, partial [Dehalococcoidia bacterium]|nr:hypothetical protein [Dehalococcoidia bacterium]